MRRLTLMRHARQSTLATADHDRPLLPEGRDQAHRVGARLASEERPVDRVLSSTALRCRETWSSVEAGLGRSVAAEYDGSLYNASPDQLADGLATVPEASKHVLLLAHNPGISLFAFTLAGTDEIALEQLREGFSPASTATFEIEGAWSTISARRARFLRFDPGG